MIPFIILFIALAAWVYQRSCRERADGKGTLADKLCLIVPAVINAVVIFIIIESDESFSDKRQGIVLLATLGLMFFYLPLVITAFNIRNFACRFNRHTFATDIFTILFGGVYWFAFSGIFYNRTGRAWDVPAHNKQTHETISSEYGWSVYILILLGFISLFMICGNPKKKRPPLVSAFLTSSVAIMLVLFLLDNIQMFGNDRTEWTYVFFMMMYYLNIFAIAVRRIRFNIAEQVRIAQERETSFRWEFAQKLHSFMSTVSGMMTISFIMMIGIIAVCEVIYIAAGQGADGFIKAYTMTADWTFSQQTPPPPVYYGYK